MGIYKRFSRRFLKEIQGASYIGDPKSRTMMYLVKKIENKVNFGKLLEVSNCLIFWDDSIEVPQGVSEYNTFILCRDASLSYAKAARYLMSLIEEKYQKNVYSNEKGYWKGENVSIGDNVIIEPGAFIDHDVHIGNNVIIKTGARIRRNTKIGDDCVLNENCVLGEAAFNLTTLSNGRRIEIPSFGGVVLGRRVYIGVGVGVSRGNANDTVIEDDVKIAPFVHVGHDAHLRRGVELRSGCIVGGFCDVGEASIIALNAVIKHRINIGGKAKVSIGSVVIGDVPASTTVFGNPAVRIL